MNSTSQPETKEAVLAELYEMIADKTLSFGCKFKRKSDGYICTITKKVDQVICDYIHPTVLVPAPLCISEIEIIGHEPTLNDVLLKMFEIFRLKPNQSIVSLILKLNSWATMNARCGKNTAMKSLWILEHYKQDRSFDEQEFEVLQSIRDLLKTNSK